MSLPPKPLVIGYGNPLRGDDGAGPFAARLLAGLAEVVTCHQLTPELAEQVSNASLVVFLDADLDTPPGEITLRRVGDPPSAPAAFAHHFDPGILIEWARRLYGHAPPAWTVGLGGGAFELSDSLSFAAETAARKAAVAAAALIREGGGL